LHAAAGTIALHEEAYVRGPQILLGEVAVVQGELAPELNQIELTSAASPGDSRRIAKSYIRSKIDLADLPETSLEITGPELVVAKTLYAEVTPQEVASDLRAYVEARMPWRSEDALVDISPPRGRLVLPEGEVTIEWRPTGRYDYIGGGAFRGEIRVDGAVVETVMCRAEIDAYGDAIIAAADIPRGTLITARHLTMEERSLEGLPRGALLDIGAIEGQVARSNIRRGEAIRGRDIEPRQLVKRNSMVTVETRVGVLVVRGRAKALNDGAAGDLVRCENLESEEEFSGVVRKDGVVVVH
jgi:flagella basal body P-ring formation protein FlgA